MRTKRLERLFRLVQALQAGRAVTVEELAQKIGVSRRTVFRDMGILSRAGLPYEFDRLTKKYSASKMALLPPVNLTHGEAMALLLAMRMLVKRTVVPDQPEAASAAMKLESMLPDPILDFVGPLLERTEIRPTPLSDASSISQMLPILQSALSRRTKLRVRYDSYKERAVIETTLHPYRVAFIHRGWYLIAYSEEAKCVQTFKVERFLQLRAMQARYRLDPTFNLDDYFGNAWLMIRDEPRCHVRLRFSPEVAANVDEIRWHKTQQTRFEPDGTLIFEVDVDGLREISWWILGYGASVEVLEPVELRRMIADHVVSLQLTYRDVLGGGNGQAKAGESS